MRYENFQQFLEYYWMENLAEGQSKEQSIDATDRWIENLDVQELIDLGDKFADQREDFIRNQYKTV